MAKLPATRDNSGDYSAIRELLAWWKVMEAPKQFQRFPWHVPSFSLNFVEPMVCDLCLFSQVGFFAFNGFCVHDIHHGVGLCENKTQASIRHMHGCAQKFIVFHRAVSTGNVRVAIAEPRYSRLQGGNVVVRYFESQHSTAGENPTPCSNHIAEEEPAFVKRRILGYNTCFLCQ